MTPSQIKQAYQNADDGSRHFFDRETMKWFGDCMSSYGVRTIDGKIYMYRKPSAVVNVFGKRKRAGRNFFSAWRFDPETNDLHPCDAETTQRVWEKVS